MEENEIIRKEAQPVNNMEPKKGNSLTIILAVIAFLALGALAYVLFFKDKGEETDKGKTPEPTTSVTTNTTDIVASKTAETGLFNVILDTNGNVFLAIKDSVNLDNYGSLKTLFDNSTIYNYKNENKKMVKINLQNVKDVQCLNYGNAGYFYILLIDTNNKLYVLVDNKIEESADMTLLTDEKLNNVLKVYSECDESACMVYADANVNGEMKKISLDDLFQ